MSLGLLGGLTLSAGVLPSGLGLLMVLFGVSPCLGMHGCMVGATPGSCLACPCRFQHPPCTSRLGVACLLLKLDVSGALEMLPPCSYVSVLLTRKRRVLCINSSRFLTTGLSLSLTESSTAGSLVVPELPAKCWRVPYRDLLRRESLFLLESWWPVFFSLVSVCSPMSPTPYGWKTWIQQGALCHEGIINDTG
jgi:hypothetical protein